MPQLGKFHLQLALMAARTLSEDVEDQRRAVDHHALQHALEVALLTGRQGMVEDHDIGLVGTQDFADFLDLSAAGKKLGIGRGALALHHGLDTRTGAQHQQLELGQALVDEVLPKVKLDQNSALSGCGAFKHGHPRWPSSVGHKR